MMSPRIAVLTLVVFTLILPASRSFHLPPPSWHTSIFRPRAHPVCTPPAAGFQLRASASVGSGDKEEAAPSGAGQAGLGGFVSAGPGTPPPSYAEADERWFDQFAINLFRAGMVRAIGEDVSTPGYPGLMELALKLNRRFPPGETRRRTRGILASFFPPFILKLFPVMFALPLPAFSAKLNAAITALTCRWLMGPIEVVDVPAEELLAGWGDGVGQGLQVKKFLGLVTRRGSWEAGLFFTGSCAPVVFRGLPLLHLHAHGGWLQAVGALRSRLISLAGVKWSCLRTNKQAPPPRWSGAASSRSRGVRPCASIPAKSRRRYWELRIKSSTQ